MRCVRCDSPVFEDDQGLYNQVPVTSPEMPGFTFMDRAHECGDPPAPHRAGCDYETGTAASGPKKCGKPSKFIWADETSRRDRRVCGIHARSARIKWHGDVRPLTALTSKDGER